MSSNLSFSLRVAVLAVALGACWGWSQSPPRLGQPSGLEPSPPNTIADAPSGPTVPTGITTGPVMQTAVGITDLAPPRLQLSVRTPSHLTPGTPVPYTIFVQNVGSTKALKVRLHMKLPEGAEKLNSAEPKPDNPATPELVWELGTMAPTDRKEFKLEFLPKPNAKEVRGTAYIGFEYGAIVETKYEPSKLEAKKRMTPEVGEGELCTVRVDVTNTGRSTVPGVDLTENNDATSEYRGIANSVAGATTAQRVWKLGELRAGQTKTVTYQLLYAKAGDYSSTSNVTCNLKDHTAIAEAKAKVVCGGVELTLLTTKPEGKADKVQATVRNTGTKSLRNLRLSIDIPEGTRRTSSTIKSEANRAGNRIIWQVPTLEPGEMQGYNLTAVPEEGVSGRKVFTARLRDADGKLPEQEKKVTIDFVGLANIRWQPEFNSSTLAVGRQDTLRVSVKNTGNATEKALTLRVILPDELRPKLDEGKASKVQLAGRDAVLGPVELAPGKSYEFVLSYEAIKTGTAYVELILSAECLGKETLTKKQTITVGK